jgi:hypothetical protein
MMSDLREWPAPKDGAAYGVDFGRNGKAIARWDAVARFWKVRRQDGTWAWMQFDHEGGPQSWWALI